MCGRSATATVGTVSLPPLTATAAAPAGPRQMSTQCSRRALRPKRMRSRRQCRQPGRQQTTGRPSAVLRPSRLQRVDPSREDQRRVHACEQHERQKERYGCAGSPADHRPRRDDRTAEHQKYGRIQARSWGAKATDGVLRMGRPVALRADEPVDVVRHPAPTRGSGWRPAAPLAERAAETRSLTRRVTRCGGRARSPRSRRLDDRGRRTRWHSVAATSVRPRRTSGRTPSASPSVPAVAGVPRPVPCR